MKVNQLKAGVFLSYLSIAVTGVTQLIYTPVMLRLLGQSEYGLYSMVSSVVGYLNLLTFGIGGAYLRFYSREKAFGGEGAVARLNGMFLLVFSASGAISIAAGSALAANAQLIFGDKLTQSETARAGILVVLLSVNVALSVMSNVFPSYAAANERYIFQRVLTVGISVLGPLVTLPLLMAGLGSLGLVLISLLTTILYGGINFAFCVKRLHIRVQFRGLRWGLLKEVYIFSAFLFLNQIINQINWSMDNIILGHVWGTVVVAAG